MNTNPNGDAGDESVNAILPARVILNEFSDAGVGVYTTERLRMGQEVALTIDDPRRFYITGKVLYCNDVRSDSKIMQQVNFPWRAGVEFIYKSDAERSEVAAYCEELRKTWLGALVPSVVPGPPKVAAAPPAATTEGSASSSEGQTPAETPAAVDSDGTKQAA